MIIEADGIRVEADTEQAALKLFKKEQRKQFAERERIAKLEHAAEQIAKTRGFDVMSRLLAKERRIPRGWGLNREFPSVRAECVGYGTYRLSVREVDRSGKTSELFTAVRDVHCYGMESTLENGAGEPLMVWLKEYIDQDASPYAIAAVNGAVGLVPMPDMVRAELFKKPETVSA